MLLWKFHESSNINSQNWFAKRALAASIYTRSMWRRLKCRSPGIHKDNENDWKLTYVYESSFDMLYSVPAKNEPPADVHVVFAFQVVEFCIDVQMFHAIKMTFTCRIDSLATSFIIFITIWVYNTEFHFKMDDGCRHRYRRVAVALLIHSLVPNLNNTDHLNVCQVINNKQECHIIISCHHI